MKLVHISDTHINPEPAVVFISHERLLDSFADTG